MNGVSVCSASKTLDAFANPNKNMATHLAHTPLNETEDDGVLLLIDCPLDKLILPLYMSIELHVFYNRAG